VLYRGGFTYIDANLWRVLVGRHAIVPYDRIVSVAFEPPEDTMTMRNLTITVEGSNEVYRPLDHGFMMAGKGPSLLAALDRLAPGRLDEGATRMLEPSRVEALLEEARTSEVPAPQEDEGLMSIIILPSMYAIAMLIGWFLGYVLYSIFVAERGLSSLRMLTLMVMTFVLMALALHISVMERARFRLARAARVREGYIEVDLGPVAGWLLRVSDPLPLATVDAVALRLDFMEARPCMAVIFSNGEEHLLPREVIEHLEGDLEAGDDPFVMRYSKGGQELDGPILRVRPVGLALVVLSLLLAGSIPYIWAMVT